MIRIHKNLKDTTLTVKIEGRIDITNFDDLESEVLPELKSYVHMLILDFEKVQTIFSCGLRAILKFQKKINENEKASMKIINVNENVLNIFEITGSTKILTIE